MRIPVAEEVILGDPVGVSLGLSPLMLLRADPTPLGVPDREPDSGRLLPDSGLLDEVDGAVPGLDGLAPAVLGEEAAAGGRDPLGAAILEDAL